jgi:5S rRNA maturation endonuclease (ribonuclease M5)/ribosomal protein L37E
MAIRIDAENVLESYGIEYKSYGKKNVMKDHVGIECKLCGDDPSAHMNIKLDCTHAFCVRCGFNTYDVKKILSELIVGEELTYKEMLTVAQEFQISDIDLNGKELKIVEEEDCIKNAKFNIIWEDFKNLNNFYSLYLKSRGISSNVYPGKDFRIGTKVGKYDFRNRIIIPIRDIKNSIVVNFIGRSIFKKSYLRYKNCPNCRSIVSASKCLFGLNYFNKENKNMVIVEGAFDAAKLLQAKVNCVALAKKKITKDQVELFTDNIPKDTNIYLFLDSDASDRDWHELLGKISPFYYHIKFIKIHGAKDIGECSNAQVLELIKYME